MTKKTKSKIAAVIGILLIVGMFLMLKIHFGYYEHDAAIANSARRIVIQQFNSRQFDAIYENFTDNAKNAVSRKEAVDAMNAAFDTYGSFVEDMEGATTCFPEQVRMVRWLKIV